MVDGQDGSKYGTSLSRRLAVSSRKMAVSSRRMEHVSL